MTVGVRTTRYGDAVASVLFGARPYRQVVR